MKKTILFLCIVLMLSSISMVLAGGVGISPAYYKVFFEPGMVKSFQFHSFNLNPLSKVNLYVQGDLSKYVSLSNHSLDGDGFFSVTVRLPQEIDVPGVHKIYVGAIESKNISEGGVIGGIASVRGRIDIIVPYPGEYAESTFSISNINEGENANYKLGVQNLGLKKITVKPHIEIYKSSPSKSILNQSLRIFTLTPKSSLNIIGELHTKDLHAGSYYAIAIVDWGKKIDKIKKQFRVGEFLVDIIDYDYLFEQNKINKFNIEIQNKWNTKINRVSANVVITDEGKVVSSFKTVSVSANPWETKNITGYFDTNGLKAKRYIASIVVSYDGKTSSKLVAIYVQKPVSRTYIKYIIIASVVVFLFLVIFIYLILKIKWLEKNENKK